MSNGEKIAWRVVGIAFIFIVGVGMGLLFHSIFFCPPEVTESLVETSEFIPCPEGAYNLGETTFVKNDYIVTVTVLDVQNREVEIECPICGRHRSLIVPAEQIEGIWTCTKCGTKLAWEVTEIEWEYER